jgi:glycosyltransferase involved in cell wall biosynthesis
MNDTVKSGGGQATQGTDHQPLVTIIVPAYNRAGGLLEETLDSILGQDYPNLECLVLDDGSTDETPQVLERYGNANPERMRWDRHENMGQAKTLNRGFEMARGELIGYLNSDDLFLEGAITKLAALLTDNPDAALAYPAYRIIDEDGESIADMMPPQYTAAEAIRLHNCIVNVGAIYRRRVIEEIGGWDTSFVYLADFDWCVRAYSVGPFLRHPDVLACWRNHPGSANYAPGLEAAREQTRMLDKIYAADEVTDDVLAVRDEAYRNAYICAAYAMGGVNKAEGRFFVHDTLAREVSSRMPETESEMNARMRQRLTNLERREKNLSETIARLRAGERTEAPRWRTALRRVAPRAMRPAGRRVIDKVAPASTVPPTQRLADFEGRVSPAEATEPPERIPDEVVEPHR